MTFSNSRIVRISTASIVAGLLIGLVGGAFRFLLVKADYLRDTIVQWAHVWPYVGWLAPVALGLIGAVLARLMVLRISPAAEGSGVQRVEAAFTGEVKPAGLAILPVKFFGGLISIGSGLALGREGPTVQMGASFASLVSRFLVKNDDDTRVVEAAGAGAGLAVAFNAPIGGSIFVFEELTSSFTPWLLLATLAAASSAVVAMRLLLGKTLDFTVPQVGVTFVWKAWPFLVLGVLLGAVGALYNLTITGLLRAADGFSRLSSIQRAALIGGTVGLAAWFAPVIVGGGDILTQAILSGSYTGAVLVALFAFRFFLGPWSYAAATPGGLFAPMLLLGACFGALFGAVLNHFFPSSEMTPVACAVVGMATLFAACVRAPLTGIMLTVEMTGRSDLILGMLAASLMAMMVTMLVNSEPIYVTLKRRMLEQQAAAQPSFARRTNVAPVP